MPIPIQQCMKRNVVSVTTDTTLGDATRLLVQKHIGLLPVVDEQNKLVGMLGMANVLELFLPSFVQLIDDIDFVHDFGPLENIRIDPTVRKRVVSEFMRDPVSVDESTGLLRAYTMMLQHEIHDLPVVRPDGTLVGIASRVDIGTGFLSTWGTGTLTSENNT